MTNYQVSLIISHQLGFKNSSSAHKYLTVPAEFWKEAFGAIHIDLFIKSYL